MTINAELAARITRLFHVEKWPVGTIARTCHVHRATVQRVLAQTAGGPAAPQPRATLLAPYVPFLVDTLAQYPTVPSSRLFDMLRARGYTGSDRTVRAGVATLRPSRRALFLRIETLPGEQAQLDWAYVTTLDIDGAKRKLWLFVIVLSHSRAMWAEFVLDLTAAALARSLVRGAQAFGGVPRVFLFDNAKTVVVERVGPAVRFHPLLVDICAALHVEPRVCGVGQPQSKGKVERAIRYLRDRFLAGRAITDVATGNATLQQFLAEVAHARPHPTLPGQTVAAVAAAERARLLPLPPALPVTTYALSVRADRQAFVRFDRNCYSVPPASADRTLTVLADDVQVRIVDGDATVALHARCWGRGQWREDAAHRAAMVAARPRAADAKGRDRLFAVAPAMRELVAAWGLDGQRLGRRVQRAILLLNQYGDAIFASAVAEAHAIGVHDLAALTVMCERTRKQQRRAVTMPLQFAPHIIDDDVVPHNLENYDDPA